MQKEKNFEAICHYKKVLIFPFIPDSFRFGVQKTMHSWTCCNNFDLVLAQKLKQISEQIFKQIQKKNKKMQEKIKWKMKRKYKTNEKKK